MQQRFSARFLGDPPNAVFSAKLLGPGAASGARGVVWGGWAQGHHFFRRILVYYLVVGVVWMCVGDEIVFGFGVAKHRECDDVSSKNTVKKAEMCRPCSLPLRFTCPVSVCLCDTEHLGRGAVVGLMLGTIRPVI